MESILFYTNNPTMKLVTIFTIIFSSFASKSLQYTLQESGAFQLLRYQGSSYNKTFYLTTLFQTTWMGAYQFCKSSGMQLVTLETQAEYNAVLGALKAQASKIVSAGIASIYAGSFSIVPASKTGWTWYDNGQKITYPLDWFSGEPNNAGNIEWCASFKIVNGVWGEKRFFFIYY
jgi:hypothetical protein